MLIFKEKENEGSEGEEDDTKHAHFDMAEVSLDLLSGLTLKHKIKVKLEIGGMEVVVLIDNGVTHNFVSTNLIKKLQL